MQKIGTNERAIAVMNLTMWSAGLWTGFERNVEDFGPAT